MLEWKSDTHVVVDGVGFAVLASGPSGVREARELAERTASMVVFKPRWMIEQYEAIRSTLEIRNFVELGIYDGGSTALLGLLFRPRRLVAFDLKPGRIPALDALIEEHGLDDGLHAYFGVDQADRTRLERILDEEFGSEPLDLVVDDASHLLDETIASFNVLFPRLRPGGMFVIEDWSAQHLSDEIIEQALATDRDAATEMMRRLSAGETGPPGGQPLSRLLLQLVLTAGYAEGIVAELTSVRKGWAVVIRGDAVLDSATFDIRSCYGSLGRTVLPENSLNQGD